MPIHKQRERCYLLSLEWRDSTLMSMDGSFTIESDHKPLESISRKNLADTPAQLQCMMLCLQGYNFTICYCPGKEMVIPDTLSWFSPHPGPDLPLDIHHPSCLHNARLQGSLPTTLRQWFRNVSSHWPHHHWLARGHNGGPSSPPSILATLRNPHHRGWSSPARWSTHHSSCQKGENHASTTSIPSRNNKVTVAHTWKFLLARHKQGHQRSSPPVWSQHPGSRARMLQHPSHLHPHHCIHGQMCATDIFTLEGIDHLVVGDFYLKMILVWHLPPGQSNANKVVSLAEGDVFREHGIP